MKLPRVFLIASLAANAALALLLVRRVPEGGAGSPSRPGLQAGSQVKAATTGQTQARSESEPHLQAASDPHVALRERLAALGFPREVVNAVVRSVIEEPRRARTREFYAALAKEPWWLGRQAFSTAQDRELRALQRAEREEILRVLGPIGYAADEQLERYSYLEPEKAAKLVALQRDYAELRRDAADEGQAGRGDVAERLKLLTEEHDRDLAALLSPEERARFEERESNSARTLGYRLEFFAAGEEEYRALLAAQRAYDDKFRGSSSPSSSPEAMQARSEAMQELTEAMRAALSPERYAQLLQAQRPEYRALVELQRRFDVPAEAFQQAARVHLEISGEVSRIIADSSLDPVQKRAELIPLAARATEGMRAALGPSLAETYLAATRSSWIDVLARGSAFTASPNGSLGTRSFGGPERMPTPPPAPKN